MRRVRQITIKYLAVFAVLLFFAGAAGCGSKKSSQMFTYTEKEDGTLEITGLTDGAREQSSFAVPAQIDGKNVTSVAREAFRDCANMKEIVLPEGIVTIGENAFLSCYNLESITFPSSVETVGTNVVKNTAWEKKEFEQSGAVIINNILAAVQNVSGEYTVPDGVVKIASGVFYGNTELTRVNTGEQLKEIGIYAFAGCTNLEEIALPSSLKVIGYGAFSHCGKLKVRLPDTVEAVGQDAFLEVEEVEYHGELEGAYWGALSGNGG